MADLTETRAQFARRARVSQAAITQACRPGGALHPACDGRLIDLSHEAAKSYLRGKGVAPPRPPRREAEPESDAPSEGDSTENYDLPDTGPSFRARYPDVSSLLDMRLRDIVDEFGTMRRLREATTARKEIAAAHSQEIKNEERLGELIEREFVETHVFGVLEELSRRLLSDAPRSLVRALYTAARSDIPMEQAELEVKGQISANLRRAKEQVTRKLRNA